MELRPSGILLSPGPCTPNEAGICVPLIRKLNGSTPIFGVCLGHQSIGAAYGASIIRARAVMHGKASSIIHTGEGVFACVPSPFTVIRYHSLAIDRNTLPSDFRITAETDDGEIMGIRHSSKPIEGVQFHPESILTEHGKTIVANWLSTLS